ncbi:unnamed protein product [Adineta steineri]|uniref:Reverse transcriptase domain-containing protein n=1 Tax=Adineta steineri TaxID=433720 RepID=A0A815T8S7_9BILA|nr:unnamed protein product [Adineta steineri]
MTTNNNVLPSSAIVEVSSPFQQTHFLLLARGPKYVPKCQSYFRFHTIEDIIIREYNRMSAIIIKYLTNNCVSASDERAKVFLISLRNLLTDLYTTKLSSKLFHHSRQEYILTKDAQHKLYLTRQQIILRRTDKSKVFHLGSYDDYEQKASNYMIKTCAYEEVIDGKCPLADNLSSVMDLLDKLLKRKAINVKQWSTMIPNRNKVELGHLYFLPKPHKIGTPLRPIISSINGPTNNVSHFLDHLIRPLFDRVAKQTTFINGIDLVRQLEKYQENGHLLPTTHFVTFDVTDLYTMIPRNGALEALGRFLVKTSIGGKIGNLSIDTILKLARLVLDTNYFVYNNKYYRQIKGGAMGSAFTMTLANVYMLEWEQPLIELQSQQGEIYGRYIDDVFMTSNMSTNVIHDKLDWMNQKDHKHIKITYSVDQKVEFLDVQIENHYGLLKTSVYRKPAAEPYILPYSSDHPRHIHMNIPYEALLQAARLCSDVYTFDKERLNIEIKLLLNGYPPQFLKYHFNRFFRLNQVLEVCTELDAQKYQMLHQKLLYLPTRREKKYQRQTTDENDKSVDKQWNRKILMLSHTYESGPAKNFRREFRKLWTKYYVYKGSVVKNVRTMITALNNPSLNDLLVRKKPPASLLTKMEILLPPPSSKIESEQETELKK